MKNKYNVPGRQWWLLMLWALGIALPVKAQITQPPVIQWQRVIDNSSIQPVQVVKASNGGYAVINAGKIVRLSESGSTIWDLQLTRPDQPDGPNLAENIIAMPDGGFAVLGRYYLNYDRWSLTRLNAAGDVVWAKRFDSYIIGESLSRSFINGLIRANDEGFIVIGSTMFGRDGTRTDLYKFDTEGNLTGIKSASTGNGPRPSTRTTKMIPTTDGGYLLVGGGTDESLNYTSWVSKLDAELNRVWQKNYGGGTLDDVIISPYDNKTYIVVGPDGFSGTRTINVGPNGEANGGTLLPDRTSGSVSKIVVNKNSATYITIDVTDKNGGELRIQNFDGLYQLGWNKTLGGSSAESMRSAVATDDGGYLIVGTTTSTDGDVQGKTTNEVSTWIVKLAPATLANPLTLNQPAYNCQTGAIMFNTTGGDGSPITYTAPGVSRASLTDNFGTVEPGLRNDPKPITITATQSGYTTSYAFDLKQFCGEVSNVLPPVLTGPIPDQFLVVGQDIMPGSVDLGKYFRDPNGFPRYRPLWTITSSGLPEGVGLATRDLDENVSPFISLFGTPVRTGSYTVTINAALPRLGVSTTASFRIIVRDANTIPPSGGTLTLIQPIYNCQTGAITFNTTGGDGSPVIYSAPGISRVSVTDNFGTVEQGLRNDPKPITITATQSGYSTSFTFDFGAYCGSVPTEGQLQLLAPTVTCGSLDATFVINTSGGDGSPITYSVLGATLSSPASNTASVFQCINAENPLVAIQATQSGYTATYSLDLNQACPNTQFGQPLIGRQIPDLTVSVGQNAVSYDVSSFFSDPNRFPRYPFIAQYSFSATGMPEGITYSTEGTRNNILVAKFSGTAPSRPGVYTVTITAGNTFCGPVVTSFKIIVVDQPGGSPLALTAPTYDCQTGALTFNTSGGNGSPIEFQAIGITDWTTNPNQFVDQESRTANDVKPFTLMARQNGQVVTYTWDLKAACGRGSGRLRTAEPGSELSVSVLGNPVVEQVRVVVRGAEGQPLRLSLSDARGHLLENRSVDRAGSAEEQTFDVGQQAPGLLLLRTTTDTQTRTIKIIKR